MLSDGPASYWKLNETKLNETSGTTATDRTGANKGTYTIWANVGSDRQCQLDAMGDIFGLRPWN